MHWGCPTVADLDWGGGHEVFASAERVYAFHADASEVLDGDGNPTTTGVWSDFGSSFWSKPAVGDLDGDERLEVVATSRYETGTSGHGHIFVWNDQGELLWEAVPGEATGHPSNLLIASPVIADLDADDEAEVVTQLLGAIYAWNHDGSPVIPSNSDGFLVFVGGDETTTWPITFGSPAVGDLDGDGKDEIVFGLQTNLADERSRLVVVDGDGTVLDTIDLETPSAGQIPTANSSPSLADVNGDEIYEIFLATRNYLWGLYYDADAQSLEAIPEWPLDGKIPISELPSNWIEPTPAIGDVNGDEILDVVVGAGSGEVVAVNGPTGQILTGFPYQITETLRKVGSAILVQVDSDPAAEILIGDNGGMILSIDGETLDPIDGFTFQFGGRIHHGLAVWDVDRNGSSNLLVQAENNPHIAVYDITTVEFPEDEPEAWARNPWPSFRHDQHNTGTIPIVEAKRTGIYEARHHQPLQLRLHRPALNPAGPPAMIRFETPGGFLRLEIFDVVGRRVRTLEERILPPGVHLRVWDGCDNSGRRVGSGVYWTRLTAEQGMRKQKLILLR
jgi:hypothetical protein